MKYHLWIYFIVSIISCYALSLDFNWDSYFPSLLNPLNALSLFSLDKIGQHTDDCNHVEHFINQIEAFEETHSTIDNVENIQLNNLISSLNNNNIKHYSQDLEFPIQLDKYLNQYILRISSWESKDESKVDENDELFYENCILFIKTLEIPIWETSVSKKFIDIQVDKHQGTKLLNFLTETFNYIKFDSNIIILDLPQTIYETFPNSEINNYSISELNNDDNNNNDISVNSEIFFKNYRELETIYSWYDLLVKSYPDILSIQYIGTTFEGRHMKALRLSVHSNKKSKNIKTFVITSGIHAREWISVSTSCFILYQLLSDYENGDLTVRKYLENLDFLFLPVMNPDGYVFTWKHERLWRKNKQQTYHPRCSGIDIDHSFNFHFDSGLESPCSEDYAGDSPFEALESYNWDKYLNETKHSHPIYAYVDLHSYAEEILYPYAYSCDILPRDEENLLELAYGLAQSIRLKTGKSYQIIKACQDKGADLLPSMGSGSALDYMYHNKAYWAIVLKLRDSGTHGFLLPSKYIVPVGTEIYASIKYFAAFILDDSGN